MSTPHRHSSPTLRETQEWLTSLILNPEPAPFDKPVLSAVEGLSASGTCVESDEISPLTLSLSKGDRPVPEKRLQIESQTGPIAVPHPAQAAQRLRVYASGYPTRVQEALTETFPALAHIIGPDRLAQLTRRYIPALTLRSYNLNDIGAELPEFLRTDPLAQPLPFLPDLAELEWDVAYAFHSHEESPLVPANLAGWTLSDWEQAVITFQPSVEVLSSEWPIRDLWAARTMPVKAIDIDLRDRPQCVMIRRAGYDVHCELLPAGEALALASLLDGCTLGEVTESLAARCDEADSVSTWFAAWMQAGMIAEVRVQGFDGSRVPT